MVLHGGFIVVAMMKELTIMLPFSNYLVAGSCVAQPSSGKINLEKDAP